MASTMTATRPLPIASVPGPAMQSNEVPVHIQPLQQSASTPAQQSNTPKGAIWSEADFVANLQSSTAQNGASRSALSQQPQQGLSSLAQAAMAGGKMKTDTPTRPGLFASNNSGNGMTTQAVSPMPTPTSIGEVGMDNSSVPTCQNCQTSTTPLWRRDEIGSVLCNACGLFLKLHGRPRPISLKTDVIKSRNRVKTSGPGQGQKKKSLFDQQNHNGLGDPNQQHGQHGTPQQNQMNQQRRPSQRSQNGDANGSHSPISRTGTPNMYGNHMSAFNGNDLVDHQFHSPSLNGMHMGRAASPGRSESSMNANLDMPQTFEQLLAANSSLKTRVSELEVINELFRGRVTQLEQDEANARRGEEMRRESERNLRLHLEESQRRENNLKRALDDMHRQVAEMRGETLDELTHKKPRLDDGMQHMSHMADMGNMGQMSSLDQDNLDHMGQGLEHVDHNIDHSLDQHMNHNIDGSMDQKFDEQKFGENLRQDLAQNLNQNLDPALDPSLGDNNLSEKFETNSNELVDPALNIKADEDALLGDELLDTAPTPEL